MFITTEPFASHPKTYVFDLVERIRLYAPYVGALVEPEEGQDQRPVSRLDSGKS